MDSSVMLALGGCMILVGFLSLIRYRFVQIRRRLSPAASIRSRNLGGGGLNGYSASSGGSAMGRSVSVLLMLGGGVVVLAGMLG
jgi:hypothetical protein